MTTSAFRRWWAKPESRLLYLRVMYYGSMTVLALLILVVTLITIGRMTQSTPDIQYWQRVEVLHEGQWKAGRSMQNQWGADGDLLVCVCDAPNPATIFTSAQAAQTMRARYPVSIRIPVQ